MGHQELDSGSLFQDGKVFLTWEAGRNCSNKRQLFLFVSCICLPRLPNKLFGLVRKSMRSPSFLYPSWLVAAILQPVVHIWSGCNIFHRFSHQQRCHSFFSTCVLLMSPLPAPDGVGRHARTQTPYRELRMLWSGPGPDHRIASPGGWHGHMASSGGCGVGLDPNSCWRECQIECQNELGGAVACLFGDLFSRGVRPWNYI